LIELKYPHYKVKTHLIPSNFAIEAKRTSKNLLDLERNVRVGVEPQSPVANARCIMLSDDHCGRTCFALDSCCERTGPSGIAVSGLSALPPDTFKNYGQVFAGSRGLSFTDRYAVNLDSIFPLERRKRKSFSWLLSQTWSKFASQFGMGKFWWREWRVTNLQWKGSYRGGTSVWKAVPTEGLSTFASKYHLTFVDSPSLPNLEDGTGPSFGL